MEAVKETPQEETAPTGPMVEIMAKVGRTIAQYRSIGLKIGVLKVTLRPDVPEDDITLAAFSQAIFEHGGQLLTMCAFMVKPKQRILAPGQPPPESALCHKLVFGLPPEEPTV